MAELTGQSSSIKPGEIVLVVPPHWLCSERYEGTNEKASRATGVSSNGEFWALHVLEAIRKLESMSKNVHIAFPIHGEDGTGKDSIEKGQEVLTMLDNVRWTLAMDIVLATYGICSWTTKSNIPSVALSYFSLGQSCNITAWPVKRKTMVARMDPVRSM